MKALQANILSCLTSWLLALALCLSSSALAYDSPVPPSPNPPRLVNDFASIIDSQTKAQLEEFLVAFVDSTSTQITVVTVDSLGDLSIAEFAQQLGESWGVGQKGKNNGVVMIVKPKNQYSNGQAFITSGYGLEGALTDIQCRHIVVDDMIPYFRPSDYSQGIVRGVESIVMAVSGEFYADDVSDDLTAEDILIILFFFGLIGLYLYLNTRSGASGLRSVSHSSDIGWILGNSLGRGSGGSDWGSFSGGHGDFGGFGGGSFGGGGGGGSW